MADSVLSKKVDEYRLRLGEREFVPLMLGGMGVNISTRQLALAFADQGGIGHISDALLPTVVDKEFKTRYVGERLKKYKFNRDNPDKSIEKFDLAEVREAQMRYVDATISAKKGDGGVFINCMEKLTMNDPRATLSARLNASLDAGIDGITLSAGLHLSSFELIKDNPRFRDAYLGVIVSSARALNLFMKRAHKVGRLPDYVVVEGPLAGGHLGFGIDNWMKFDLAAITQEVLQYLREQGLADQIRVIPAGGIFTGTDAVSFLDAGASAIQVATRFTIAQECGFPDSTKQKYFEADEEDIEVNLTSPTGYPMRMLKSSPSINSNVKPNCESYGYLLDWKGYCSYVEAYNRVAEEVGNEEKVRIKDKMCICTHMRKYNVWTCGHTTYRLKDTANKNTDGIYEQPTAAHIFQDYQFSTHHEIKKPPVQ